MKKQQKNKPEKQSGPPFVIRMGVPTMEQLWRNLEKRSKAGELSQDEERLYKKWGKALNFLKNNPFYPSLNSHEITTLTQKYRKKIFESYLENHTPGAARMFWVYGPKRGEITILALEPHPEIGAYGRIKLDSEPILEPEKTITLKLHLFIDNNSKFVRGQSRAIDDIESYILSAYDAKKRSEDRCEYEFSLSYKDDQDLEKKVYDLMGMIHSEADIRNCYVESSISTLDGEKSW